MVQTQCSDGSQKCVKSDSPHCETEAAVVELPHSQYYTNRTAMYKNNKFHATTAMEAYQTELIQSLA